MLKSRKHIFWEALLITILIFGIGVFLGVVLENLRAGKIADLYSESDINLLDMRALEEILNLKDVNCEEAVRKNIEFGDKIFQDAQELERYEKANKLTDFIIQEHKRYDLLRTLFWINSIKIKEKCEGYTFHTLVYLYDYDSEDMQQINKQNVFAKFLEGIKDEYSDEVILIPIARNMNLLSVELLTKNYNIMGTSIILDETLVISELSNLELIRERIADNKTISS